MFGKLDSVGWPYEFGWALLLLRRPGRQARQETTMWVFEIEEGVRDVTAIQSEKLVYLMVHSDCPSTWNKVTV
jgi:hypothetical protein